MAKNDSQDLPFYPDGDSEDEIGLTQTQFVDDPEAGPLFEAKAILKERADKYLVDWFGVDEKGKPWRPTWEPKSNCTNALIKEWKRSQTEIKDEKKEAKKVRKDQASTSNWSSVGQKRKRNTSEPTSQASSSTVKKPRASNGKKAAPPSASSSGSASAQPQQLRLQSTPSRTSSVASGTASNRKTRGPKAAEEDEYEDDNEEQEHQQQEDDEEEEEEQQESPRRRSTYSRKKTALFVKPKTKAAVVDSDEDIEDVEEPSQDVEVVIGSSSEVGQQDEDEEEEAIHKSPKKKRVRPNFNKPVPPKSKPTKPISKPTTTIVSDEDDDEAEEDKLPQKKRARKGRKSAPSSTVAAAASQEEDEESQETEVVPTTPPPADEDPESSSPPGDAREEELLPTVHKEDEPEEEAPDQTMDDGWDGDDNDEETFGYRDQDDEEQQPVAGPSGTTGDADMEQDEEPSQEADTSRGTIIPDSQQQRELSSSLPSPLPAAAASLPAEDVAENSNSQSDELEESSEEERPAPAPAPAPAKPTTSKPVKPLGEYSPSRIRLLAEQEPEPLSSQVEEFTSSSLENTSVGAKKGKGKKKKSTSGGASSRRSNGRVSTSSTTTNAEAGPSQSCRQQQQVEAPEEVEKDKDEVIDIASSVEEDEVVEEEPIVAAEEPAPAVAAPPPPIIITSGTEFIISSFSSSVPKPVSAPASIPSSPSTINAAKSSLKSIASLSPPLSRSLDDDSLRQALLPSGSNSTTTSATGIASTKSLDSSKPMVPLSSIRKQFSFSNAAAAVEDPVASSSGRKLNGGEAALRAIEKAMRADASNGAGELREGSSRSEEDGMGNDEDYVLPTAGPGGEDMDKELEVAMVEEEEVVVIENGGGEMDVDDDAVLNTDAPTEPSTPVRAVRDKGKSREEPRPIVSNGASHAGFDDVNLQEDDELALLPASATKSSTSKIPNPTLESQILLRLQTAVANERTAKSLLTNTQSMLTDTQSALTSAEAQITHLTARVVSAGEERDFVKTQYTESSNHAARFARELRTAEELVAKLQKQVDVGLRQQQAIQDARVSKITEERDQLASTVRLLNDQRRATDDAVRAKAARVPELEKSVVERENFATEQEDLKEIALEALDKLQGKYEQLRRRKDRDGGGASTSSIPVTIPRRPAATSSASASESSSEEDEDDNQQQQRQQPRPPQQHQNQQSSSSSSSEEEENQEEGQPFSSQNFDDDDENGSESGDEFRPNNVPRRGAQQSPPAIRRQSSRSTQVQAQAQSQSQPSTVPFSQRTTLPSSSSQDHGPPAFQRPPAGEDTDSDSSSDSSGVVLVSSSNGKGKAKEAEEMELDEDDEPLLPPQGSQQFAQDQEMMEEEQVEVAMPLEMVICRWREDPRVECGAAFGSLEAMASHYDVVHLV